MNRYSEKIVIDKTISTKSIKILINEPKEKNLSISMILGKSAKRETLLREVEEKLRLNIYDC